MTQPEPERSTLAARLKYARTLRGMTQDELGRHLGMKDGVQISRWESGDGPTPNARRLPQLAEALGITIAWLVDGSGNGPVAENVSRGTSVEAPPSPPLKGEALMDLVRDYGAKVDALRAEGGNESRIQGLTEGLALAIRHMFEHGPNPDLTAYAIAEYLLSADEPAPPRRMEGGGGRGGGQGSPGGETRHEARRDTRNDTRQQRGYRSAS